MILAPSTTVLYRLNGGQYIDMIYASAVSIELIDAASEEIRQSLRMSHRLEPGDDDDFSIRTQTEITEAASVTSRALTLLLGAVAGVSLIVGGIGIMNIMLVPVTERTREIGIRLSVGGRTSDIRNQFLTEAIVLSLIGGIIGILMGIAVSFSLDRFANLSTLINPLIMVIAFGFSGAVGIFFGYYPAQKAANLNPIDALRHE